MATNIAMVSSSALTPLISFLQYKQAPIESWLNEVGLPEAILNENNLIVPAYPWWQLLAISAERLKIDDIGFQQAEFKNFQKMRYDFKDVFELAHTLIDALKMVMEITEYHSSNAQMHIESTENGCWFGGSSKEMPDFGQVEMSHCYLADLIFLVRYFLGENWKPNAIKILHDDSKNIIKKRFPKSNIFTRNSTTAIFIEKVKLNTVNSHFIREISKQKSRLKLDDSNFTMRVYTTLFSFNKNIFPNQDKIADIIGLTPRQIRLRLAKEKTTYRKVLNQLRCDLACYYLTNTEMLITEIAFELHYKNVEHFTRAFKSWKLTTPSNFRCLQN